MAPMAFSDHDPILTTTIPTFFLGSAIICLFIGTLSCCHWVASVQDNQRKKLLA